MISLSAYSDSQQFIARFCELPEKLSHNKNRPLPKKEYWSYLLSIFPLVKKELFLTESDGVDLGRICVNISEGNPGVAFFGMLEYPVNQMDVAKDLFSAAESWAKKQGAKIVIGPVDINVWFGNRFQTEGFESQFSWAPNNPREYYDAAISCDYTQDQGYSSKFYDALKVQADRTKPGYDLALSEGFTFRHLDLNNSGDISRLYELNVDSFKINYLYEPISKEQYFSTHIEFIKGSDLSYSYFIVDENEVPRGYVYCFMEGDCLIIKSILIQSDYQGAKLSSALIHRACREAHDCGFNKGAGVLIRDGNVSAKFYEKIGEPYLVHRYHMVKKYL